MDNRRRINAVQRGPLARAVALLAIFLLLLACSTDKPDEPEDHVVSRPRPGRVVVAMGNSLTEGLGVAEEDAYPARLEVLLRNGGYDVRIVNAGISGETSSGARSRVDWMLTLNPHVVILETGANDGFRGVSPVLIKENLVAIIREFKKNGVVVVLGGMKMVRNLGSDYSDAFERVYTEVAREEELLLVPFFLEGVAGREELNRSDGIHPNEKGYALIAELVLPYVIDALALTAGRRQ